MKKNLVITLIPFILLVYIILSIFLFRETTAFIIMSVIALCSLSFLTTAWILPKLKAQEKADRDPTKKTKGPLF